MSQDPKAAAHEAPAGANSTFSFQPPRGGKFRYTAHAGWTVLHKQHRPVAEMFHVAYLRDTRQAGKRPLTFVFNGGPGAASAYLHMGALGPRRVMFNADGSLPAMPTQLCDNPESWLPFTDLVFIDPIGTGLSRVIPAAEGKEADDAQDKADKKTRAVAEEFYSLNKDLDTLGEFIERFLSDHGRWLSPVYIAGESYGGFRVARLVKHLQEQHGVGLCGAMLISPALEWYFLNSSDYDVIGWAALYPSLVAAAQAHGRSSFGSRVPLKRVLGEAEDFALRRLVPFLAAGEALPANERREVLQEMAKQTGLTPSLLERQQGRVDLMTFCRELLRDKGRVCGLYDASVSTADPFPDRPHYEGPDPTLAGIDSLFSAGINSQLRDTIGLKTDRRYTLLSMEVNSSWKVDQKRHAFESQVGSTDELRYGMSLNPHMKVRIVHGLYDLVTPYFGSARITGLMKLDAEARRRIDQINYKGGHMFYSWEESRKRFTADTEAFYKGGK